MTAGIDTPDRRGRTGLDRHGRDLTGNPQVRITDVFTGYMSPGSVTERLHFFAAPYGPATATAEGGGGAADAKTIMLLQWAALDGPFRHRPLRQ